MTSSCHVSLVAPCCVTGIGQWWFGQRLVAWLQQDKLPEKVDYSLKRLWGIYVGTITRQILKILTNIIYFWCYTMIATSVIGTMGLLLSNIFRVTGPFRGEFTGHQFPSQRLVTRSFDVFFNLRLNKRLSKQSRHWWFETPSPSSWRHCNG